MKEFVVIITCLTPEYHKIISPEFISLGYTVAGTDDSGKISVDTTAISIISYVVSHTKKTKTTEVIDDFKLIIKKVKAYYYSFVVFEHSAASWHVGNIECETDPTRVLQLKSLW